VSPATKATSPEAAFARLRELSGFECRFPEGDHHSSELSIRSVVEFDERASSTAGLVRVDLTWRDKGSGFESAHEAGFFVRLLVVGFE
jgi:hypothetical protein